MEKESVQNILSLRNIYRLLTVKDYPNHSNGILRETKRQGLTLVSFWQENLTWEFRRGPYGKKIWRTEGARNRYVSQVCNRSLNPRFYAGYTGELLEQCRPGIILKQVRRFFVFLKERQFDAEAFGKKLPQFLLLLKKSDPFFSDDIYSLFYTDDGTGTKTELAEKAGFIFSYKLTLLCLLALMGSEMEREYHIFKEASLSPDSLWESFLEEKKNQKVGLHFESHSDLTENVLPVEHFFGRERELFDLRERLICGGKYLFRGIGGVGKTELIRQFVRICRKESLVDEIVLISYEDSFLQSLERTFNIYKTKDNNDEEAIARIWQLNRGRLLVVVDGVDKTMEEDGTLSILGTLPGTIFVTGRISSLPGFERYEVDSPSRESGLLIFRDNCGRILNEKELSHVEEMLKNPLFCHTLTLQLLGRLARDSKVTGEKWEITGHTQSKQYEALLEMYRSLYNMRGFTQQEEQVLKMLSLLPYRVYPFKFIQNYLKDFSGLVDSGWLMTSKQGVLMHPVIAESIRSDAPPAEDYEAFFVSIGEKMQKACKAWAGKDYLQNPDLAWREYSLMAPMELFEDAENIFRMAFKLRGSFSKRQQLAILMALELLSDYVNVRIEGVDKYLEIFEKMLKECHEEKEALRIRCAIAELTMDEKGFKDCIKGLTKINGENDEIAAYYRIKLALLLAHKGDFTESVDLLLRVHEKTQSRIFLIWIESNLEGILHKCGRDFGDEIRQLDPTQKAWDRVMEEGDRFINGQLRAFLLFNLANHRLNQGRLEAAKEAFGLLEDFLEEGSVKDLYLQSSLFYLKGTILGRQKDYIAACDYLEKAKALMGLYPMARGMEAIFTEELAVAQDKAGRMAESEKSHLEAIAAFENLENEPEGAYRAHANLASLYLTWERPKDALECLERCGQYEAGHEGLKNGPGHGVVLGHYAQAYYDTGEYEKAESYAREAEKVLTEFFGPEHEKVKQVQKILAEIPLKNACNVF